jgi:hypothetical protein
VTPPRRRAAVRGARRLPPGAAQPPATRADRPTTHEDRSAE